MAPGHNFTIWREPNYPDIFWGKIWARCKCGHTCFASTYDEIGWLTADHHEEQLALQHLEAEEKAHT